MRPLKVTMQAFGSYGKRTEIDLTEPNQNLFLVTGDTGSGKSTIFDAIVFALYGEASSTDNTKSGVELQSQFAGMDIEPFVELEFEEAKGQDIETYQVRRIPKHVRPKRRGAKSANDVKDVNGSVALTMPDGRDFIGKSKEIDAKIEEIVGLTKQQFMQVAMIAQGEFMKLLREDSKSKKEIFRKLFGTGFYNDIVEELGNRNREISKDLAKVRTELQTLGGKLEIPESYSAYEEMAGLKSQIKEGNLGRLEDFMAELERLCAFLISEQEKYGKDEVELRQKRDAKRDALTAANNTAKLFAQLSQAKEELQALEAQREEQKQKENIAGQIQNAYEVKQFYDRYKESEQDVQRRQKRLEVQQAAYPNLQSRTQTLEEEDAEKKQQMDSELQKFTKVKEQVERDGSALDQLEQMEEEYRHQEEQLVKIKRDLQRKQTTQEEQKGFLVTLEQKLEQGKDARVQLEQWSHRLTQAKKLQEDGVALEKEGDALSYMESQEKEYKAQYREASNRYEQKKAMWEEMRKHFLDTQAGILVQELREGEPCPICGSLDHPSPFQIQFEDGKSEITSAELNHLEGEVESLRKQQEEIAKHCSEVNGRTLIAKEQMEHHRDKLLADLTEVTQDTLDSKRDIVVVIRTFVKEVEVQYATAQRAVKELTKMEEQLSEGKISLDTLEKTIQKLMEKRVDIEKLLEGRKAKEDTLKAGLSYANREDAKSHFSKAKADLEQIKLVYADTHQRFIQVKQEMEQCAILIEREQTELPEQKEILQKRKEQYGALCQEKGLSKEEWKSCVEAHPMERSKELQEAVDEYKRQVVAAESAVKTTELALRDVKEPDLEALQLELQEAEHAWMQVEEVRKTWDRFVISAQTVQRDFKDRMANRREMVEKSGRIENLYKMASGNISGARMDLETYAQRYYLKQILHSANKRFLHMSGGQFELRMVDLQRAGEGKNRGLDLMVYSNVTGKEREVRTLSGGESFMAALSLALGMADQIQERSSAIHLDIMFIDEGFGSLDDHAREQAVMVLKEMAQGNKLIGIISHVTELKQEIDNQLLVTKREDGSHAKWLIS